MEALAIVIVAVVAAIIFVVTWFGVQSGGNILAERAHLEAYRDTLQRKALRAQLERWDEAMLDQLAYQLEEVEQRLAKIPARS
jgi:Tfp pilus assembly protein PilO